LKKFLENPTTLKADDIEELFIEAWCKAIWWRWSHKKILYNNILILTMPIHNWDCIEFYKKHAKKIYLNNFN
jgi:hypothetical protein